MIDSVQQSEIELEYKISTAQIIVPAAAGMAVATCLLYLGLRLADDPMTAGELRVCLQSAAVGLIGLLFFPRAKGARTNAQHLVTFPVFGRPRHIHWADITAIAAQRTVGIRHVSISLTTGERLNLIAPTSFLNRHFDHQMERLINCWETYRG
ncbi:hypothetical protein ACFV0C_23565 [Streptomyces sp. NPDC059568]|uniref:hypothetical protein n=1 Tax=Streptomyces sp. NPDC059568 TaxID=3346868 RepID=UPI0036BC8905